MADIRTDIVVCSHDDEARARRGQLPRDQVREMHLVGALVATDDQLCSLPEDVIAYLGLPRERRASATGSAPPGATLHRGLTVEVLGRATQAHCLALPEGSTPTLGRRVLQDLGLEPDNERGVLRLLPDTGAD